MTTPLPPQRLASRTAIVVEDTPIARVLPQRARRIVGAEPGWRAPARPHGRWL